MTVSDLIALLTNRLAYLQAQRSQAINIGDIAQITAIDGQITETQLTLDQLKTLV